MSFQQGPDAERLHLEQDDGGVGPDNPRSFQQRSTTWSVVGDTLGSTIDLTFNKRLIGDLWLADLERTAWRVLLAAYTPADEQTRADFREGWENA